MIISPAYPVTLGALVLADINGKWVTSPKAINIYREPGGPVVRVSTPKGYIGKVYGMNTKGNWIQLARAGEWIIVDSSYTFTDRLTQFQLDDYAKKISSAPRKKANEVQQEVADNVKFNIGENPIESLVKKYALPAILIAGGIYLVATFGKAFIQGKLAQPSVNGFLPEKQLPGKSLQASQVLQLMDKDWAYAQAVKMVVREHTKGMSANKTKQFKRKLENELNRYI